MTAFDDRLRTELGRRSDSVQLPREWARHDLLPAVMAGIGTRPQRVASSRAPAFAGLAAVVAIVLILVIALPRLALGPGQTANGTESEALFAAPTPMPNTLTTNEFASRLASGDLVDETVVVAGKIVASERPATAVGCPAGGPDACLIGELEGADPFVSVATRWLAMPEGEGRAQGYTDRWTWWSLRQPPVEGDLVLKVTGAQSVEYIGRLRDSEPRPLMVSGAKIIDVENLATDDVVLVDAWLMGEDVRECPPGEALYASLRGRDCDPSWLTDSQLGTRSAALLLQDEAYFSYAVDGNGEPVGAPAAAGPHRGVYALAKRLEAGGCPDVPPCWQWEIVGRITPGFEPSGSSREISCANAFESSAYGAPTIADDTGAVLSCSMSAAGSDAGHDLVISNPDGNLRQLHIEWAGSPCDVATKFTLFRTSTAYVIDGNRPDGPCRAAYQTFAMTIELNRDIDASEMSASFTAIVPNPSPTPEVADYICGAAGASITDETGLVETCEDFSNGAPAMEPLLVDNPAGNLQVLRMRWAGVCNPTGHFTLRPVGHDFQLLVDTPTPEVICDGFTTKHDVRIQLSGEVARSDLMVAYNQLPDDAAPSVKPAVHWDLAPSVRPTASTEWLEFLVYEAGCPDHTVPSGRVRDPQIGYSDAAVAINFSVVVRTTSDCPTSGDIPIRVHLDEPLGDRKLIDGEFNVRVPSHDDGLLVVRPTHSSVSAPARFSWLLGEDACPQYEEDRPPIDEARYLDLAAGLSSTEGMLGDGLAYVGNRDDAVRALGGFELYQDTEDLNLMIAFADDQPWLPPAAKPGDLVVADLTVLEASDGRAIFIPGTEFLGYGSPDCEAVDDGTGAVESSASAGDFEISIRVPDASNAAGQAIPGLEATFTYSGEASPLTIVGSGTGFIYAVPTQIDGGLNVAFGVTDDCRVYQVTAGEPRPIEFLTSNFTGGQSASLPPGVYRLSIHADFYVGECGGPRTILNTSIFIRVR